MVDEYIKVDSIKISVGGAVVELKIEDARKLWSELDQLFGPKPAAPVWVAPWYPPYQYEIGTKEPAWEITCCNDNGLRINPNAEPFPERWIVSNNSLAIT